MKRSVLFAAIATCAMFGAAQVEAKPVFMKYEGVKGESQKKGRPKVAVGDVNGAAARAKARSNAKSEDHKEWIPVESARSTRGGGAGKVAAPGPKPQKALLVPAVQKAH